MTDDEPDRGAAPQSRLVAVAAFLLTGLVLGERFTYFPLLVLGLLTVILLVRRWIPDSSTPIAIILFPLLLGLFYYQIASRNRVSDLSPYLDQGLLTFEGRIEDPVRHYADHQVGILAIQKVLHEDEWREVPGRVRLTVGWPDPGFLSGDLLRIQAELRSATGFKNPGGFDYAEYLRRDGIQAVATVSRPERVMNLGAVSGAVMRRIAIWREEIRRAILGSLPDREAAILMAMIIGESGYLHNKIRDDFMASGTTHILSISGSHLGLVAFVVFFMTRWALRFLPASIFLRLTLRLTPSQIAACATFFPVLFYALLAGGQVATMRRRRSPITSLSVSTFFFTRSVSR